MHIYQWYSRTLSPAQAKWWAEIDRYQLLGTGAIKHVFNLTHLVSTFCVPYHEVGQFRLITDFRPLNVACADLPVALDNVHHLRHLFG